MYRCLCPIYCHFIPPQLVAPGRGTQTQAGRPQSASTGKPRKLQLSFSQEKEKFSLPRISIQSNSRKKVGRSRVVPPGFSDTQVI